MANYKVIVTARSFGNTDRKAYDLLEAAGCTVKKLVAADGPVEEQLRREIVDADAVIAGLEDYDKALIDSAKQLKVISRYGVGYDKVDVAAATEKGIQVTITPGANGDSVADLAVALMLDGARNVTFMNNSIKSGKQERPSGLEMWDKTLGVVGAGRIGKGVAYRCKGFRMRILCYDQFQDQAFADEVGATYVDFDTLLSQSDVISLHMPLLESNRHMIDRDAIARMKDGVVIVNCSRGELADIEALIEGIETEKIGALGMDTAEGDEGIIHADHRVDILPNRNWFYLHQFRNVIMTQHMAFYTDAAVASMVRCGLEGICQMASGQSCPTELKADAAR